MEVEIGEIPELPQTPEADGYVFTGWYFDEELTDRYFFDYPLYEDDTLYAQFYDTTLGEYHVISTIDQWNAIKDDPTAKYLLARNINGRGETLTPIDEFSGELQGNGYKIFNFSINETTNTSGLIRTNNGTVSNLSVGDFTFDILASSNAEKAYGMVAAKNNGTITNCDILDSEMKLDITTSTGSVNIYIGSIAGHNLGAISDCTNRMKMNVTTMTGPNTAVGGGWDNKIFIGGLIGINDEQASLVANKNYGEIVTNVQARGVHWTENYGWTSYYGTGRAYPHIGGISGYNVGMVDACSTESTVTNTTAFASSDDRVIYAYFGQGFGQNDGKIENTYAKGELILTGNSSGLDLGGFVAVNNGEIINSYVEVEIEYKGTANTSWTAGGFVSLNKGKLYNCYTKVDIVSDTNLITAIGGFVGDNQLVSGYPATINKCFATGSIVVTATPTDCGLFAGKNTGTLKDSYYADTYTMNLKTVETVEPEGETSDSAAEPETVEKLTPVETTCKEGSMVALNELLSMDFLENTLYFDRTIWILKEGKFPTLR